MFQSVCVAIESIRLPNSQETRMHSFLNGHFLLHLSCQGWLHTFCCIRNNEFGLWNVCLKIIFGVFVINVFFILGNDSPFCLHYQRLLFLLSRWRQTCILLFFRGTYCLIGPHAHFYHAKACVCEWERECVNAPFVMVSTKAGLHMPCIAVIICVRLISC